MVGVPAKVTYIKITPRVAEDYLLWSVCVIMRIHHSRMDHSVTPDSSTSRETCSLLQGCRNGCDLSLSEQRAT